MSLALENADRRIVPKWRSPARTLVLHELSPTVVGDKKFDSRHLRQKIEDWSEKKGLSYAADIISSAFVLGETKNVQNIAEYVLKNSNEIPSGIKLIAHRVLGSKYAGDNDPFAVKGTNSWEQIRFLKERLLSDPRDALLWIELARLYTIEGHSKHARRAAENAVRLNGSDRFILRSAARFFVHIGEHDIAHQILQKSALVKTDPWVLAAEIAIAQIMAKDSRNIKLGHRLLNDLADHPFHTSELAGALASVEFEAGELKKGRKLFRRALIRPTENSIAQAAWASRNISEIEIGQALLDEPSFHEARTIEYFFDGEWDESLSENELWCDDQPFSSRATILASYTLGTVRGDYGGSLSIALRGLNSNWDDPTLLNNVAFAHASLNNTIEANRYLKRINVNSLRSAQAIAYLATKGLILFREGEIDLGRSMYSEAIAKSAQLNYNRQRALASIYLTREEIVSKSGEKDKAFRLAEINSKKVKDLDVRALFDRLVANIDSGNF